jgi:hypothetical protein
MASYYMRTGDNDRFQTCLNILREMEKASHRRCNWCDGYCHKDQAPKEVPASKLKKGQPPAPPKPGCPVRNFLH